ncbi:hypothetical protein [Nocardia brevicatena]|uniref:hypothetical protein n=1 Tax=Nocardia brevicatena TaxID=37327 RepID=UPI0002F798FF|nr:hypothetical protein [Nocardia brevicatena]
MAWHPDEPLLLVAGEGPAVRWTPAGQSALEGLPALADYGHLAFSPNGQALWASPSSVVDLASGALGIGPAWDTGVAAHPAGGLVATLRSDQGTTLIVFARVDQEGAPAMRVLRRALILDVDGYETPIFSADGRHLAIRGNAYVNSLAVFEFPSLERVLETTLGEPYPGYDSHEWLERMRSWSRYNIAFGAQPGVLWIGTPTGALVEVDLDDQSAVEHDAVVGSPVTALTATATGELVVATAGGDLVLLSVHAASAKIDPTDSGSLRALVAAFLDSTCEVPDDGDLETDLFLTDGSRTWEPGDLAAVTTATSTDPTWLQRQAAINNTRDREK